MGPEQLKPYLDFFTLKHLKRKHTPEYEKLFLDQVEDPSEVVNGSNHRSTTELSSSNTKQNRIAKGKHYFIYNLMLQR
ncbi:unnamed protein product [Rotaria socialis]|nr:unnamed protein product [Rotaria socialis]